jgi:membrane protein implicated in regulation of membrane protease activity
VDADHGGGPSIFSVKMIALLMVGFGAGSFGVRATTDASMFQASLAGIGGAVVIGAVGYAIIRAFYTSQASSTITNQDIIGCEATLIDAISKSGNGQVSCILRGREMTYLARSKDGQSIAKGTPVKIISRTGNIVTVEPLP